MKHIVVCIKQVPDTTDIKWTPENNIAREGLLSVLNPNDEGAINLALKLKKQTGAKVSVFSMGPNQAKEVLQFALALGCDEAFLLSDKKFGGSDTLATGRTLAGAIKKIVPNFDLIICGQFALDGDTAQTGVTVANFLDIEHICWVLDANFESNKIKVKKEDEEGMYEIEAALPVLICSSNESFKKINPKIDDYIRAQNSKIRILGAEELEILKEDLGILGSPTYVSRVFRKQVTRKSAILENIHPKEFLCKINSMRNDGK